MDEAWFTATDPTSTDAQILRFRRVQSSEALVG
jgi:hypothetical protein